MITFPIIIIIIIVMSTGRVRGPSVRRSVSSAFCQLRAQRVVRDLLDDAIRSLETVVLLKKTMKKKNIHYNYLQTVSIKMMG